MAVDAIVTIPPYAPFIKEVIDHPIVSGIRLNTVMPTKGSLEDLLKRLKGEAGDKDLWIDLKYRQLRVTSYGIPPFTEIEISHDITVDTPVLAYFSDGKECAEVVAVDGKRLMMLDGPRRMVGPGESVNIVDPSLKIDGFFTDTDRAYIDAGLKVGVKNYMLSFVESAADVDELRRLYPEANIVAKIESKKGLDYVASGWDHGSRLMAARGDLFIEAGMPHEVIKAVEDIVRKDPEAIAASRIFPSLAQGPEPSCSDIGDVDNLMRMGYRTFMLGDEICMQRDSLVGAMNLLEVMARKYAD